MNNFEWIFFKVNISILCFYIIAKKKWFGIKQFTTHYAFSSIQILHELFTSFNPANIFTTTGRKVSGLQWNNKQPASESYFEVCDGSGVKSCKD